MKIYRSVTELIGNTPLIELINYQRAHALGARVLAKLESGNPAGSVKDRVAKAMIEQAEREGRLRAGATIIEPTSGNTGIGLAAIAAAKGYKAIIVMPDTMSVERRNLMKAYGAEVALTEGAKGMQGAIARAEELARETGGIVMGQFETPANPQAHFETTGPEIWEDTQGQIDIFVAGVGTGGTLSGAGAYLKQRDPAVKIVAVEPFSSPVLSKGKGGLHGIQGIGAGFVPQTLNTQIYDEVIAVKDENAFSAAKELARREGILAGISSGAALYAAAELARRPENAGKIIVTIFPDTGERYLSAAPFNET